VDRAPVNIAAKSCVGATDHPEKEGDRRATQVPSAHRHGSPRPLELGPDLCNLAKASGNARTRLPVGSLRRRTRAGSSRARRLILSPRMWAAAAQVSPRNAGCPGAAWLEVAAREVADLDRRLGQIDRTDGDGRQTRQDQRRPVRQSRAAGKYGARRRAKGGTAWSKRRRCRGQANYRQSGRWGCPPVATCPSESQHGSTTPENRHWLRCAPGPVRKVCNFSRSCL
jgi:hypothetical protein